MKLRTVNMKQYNERKYLIVDEKGLPIPRLCEFTLTHLYGAEKTQENNANHLRKVLTSHLAQKHTILNY